MKKQLPIIIFATLLTSCGNNASTLNTPSTSITMPFSTSSIVPSISIDEEDLLSKMNDVNYGETFEIEYTSTVTKNLKHATIHLPYNYNENETYPVLYLLHGMFGNHSTWFTSCNAGIIIDNAISKLGIKPLIVVGVNSFINGEEKEPSITSTEFTEVYDLTGKELIESLVPYINENYPTKTEKEFQALAGYSMGGRETLLTAFTYQDYFNYLGAFSSASFNKLILSAGTKDPVLTEFKINSNSSGFKYILLSVGKNDMFTGSYTPLYSSMMDKENIENEVVTFPGAHDFSVWKLSLLYFIKNLTW